MHVYVCIYILCIYIYILCKYIQTHIYIYIFGKHITNWKVSIHSLRSQQKKSTATEFPRFLGLQRSEFTIAIRSFFSASCNVDVWRKMEVSEQFSRIPQPELRFLVGGFRGFPSLSWTNFGRAQVVFFGDKLRIPCAVTQWHPQLQAMTVKRPWQWSTFDFPGHMFEWNKISPIGGIDKVTGDFFDKASPSLKHLEKWLWQIFKMPFLFDVFPRTNRSCEKRALSRSSLGGYQIVLLMEKILHHLGCIKPCKYWDKLPTSTG